MAFLVKIFPASPDFESLHVAKLTCFPLEKRDYKPYSQARICFAGDGLHLQFVSFEATPLDDSFMKGIFSLTPGRPLLSLSLYANQKAQVALEEETHSTSLTNFMTHFFTGEDLQGVYWGGNLFVPNGVLAENFPDFSVKPKAVFQGNFYKICENPGRPHYGCYYSTDFSKWLGHPENLGAFQLMDF